ncbi:carbonic anhydrase [Undibacterium sp. RuRC25W]|uniref:carbonic anhydrase n=1 Tax=Undibacterium sp. RuRC25W TaxID=3413047 RepID=UPI003BF20E22
MRRYSVLLLSLLLAISAFANEGSSSSPPSKPIKQASSKEKDKEKEESSSSSSSSSKEKEKDKEKDKEKEGKKSSKEAKESKESKESKDAAKESLAADELAAKIAERLAILKKEKESVSPAAAARSVMRPTYAARRAEPAKPKAAVSSAELHGTAAIAAAMDAHGAGGWTYQGDNGPLSWGKLNLANAKCDSGDRQSPIDIRDGIKVNLDPIVFDYRASGFNVIDNGHTIQVNVGAGNYITVMGRNYELVQFHFHKPSEERVNGRGFEMVIHLVHKDADGKLAVIAVLIERGKPQNAVQQVWNNLPLEKNQPQEALTALDLNQLLPGKRDYFTYMGSLTTPPCSEGVLWMVMKEPIELSSEQLAIFNHLYPMNARPMQKASGRLIKESN